MHSVVQARLLLQRFKPPVHVRTRQQGIGGVPRRCYYMHWCVVLVPEKKAVLGVWLSLLLNITSKFPCSQAWVVAVFFNRDLIAFN